MPQTPVDRCSTKTRKLAAAKNKPAAKQCPRAKRPGHGAARKNLARGGGWNRKTLAEHLRDGTYRADRHGPAVLTVAGGKKPPGKVRAIGATRSAAGSAARAMSTPSAPDAASTSGWPSTCATGSPRTSATPKAQWRGEPFTPNALACAITFFSRCSAGCARTARGRFRRILHRDAQRKTTRARWPPASACYMLAGDEEPGAEIWSLGGDKNQARVVHDDAVTMADGSPKLARAVEDQSQHLQHRLPGEQQLLPRRLGRSPRQARPEPALCDRRRTARMVRRRAVEVDPLLPFVPAGSRCCW